MEDRTPHPSEALELNVADVPFLATQHAQPGSIDHTSQKSRPSEHVEYITRGHERLHLNRDTLAATTQEHCMTFAQGFKLYPKAVCWSLLISMAIIMEGFDTALINSYFAFDQFRRDYGVRLDDGTYEITAQWQTSLNNGAVVSSILGLFANGILTERFGYRRTMMGALLFLACCIFVSFFAVNIHMLLAGQILCGFSWGVFSTLTTTYAAEVVPLNLRGYLTANVNLCWLIGQIIAAGVLRALGKLHSAWSYRIPFGLQWGWIVVVLVVAFLAPESPWWLVRKKRLDEARQVLLRLTRRGYGFDAQSVVTIMDHTNDTEKRMNGNRVRDVSYLQCFRGTNLRRTEIACMMFVIQNISGLPVISFAAYFYGRLGFDQTKRFNLTLALQGIALLGAMCSILLMKFLGRRTLYLGGLFLQMLTLAAAGATSTQEENTTNLWATASLILVFIFIFDCALGPVTYCLIAEMPSSRLRVKTVVLARVCYNLSALITNTIQTRMLNPQDWNWRGKSCFFWAGSCALCFIYCYFRLPDTKGLTYLELDVLFDKGATARQFGTFQKKLASCGYFSFNEYDSQNPQWTERCASGISHSPTFITPYDRHELEKT